MKYLSLLLQLATAALSLAAGGKDELCSSICKKFPTHSDSNSCCNLASGGEREIFMCILFSKHSDKATTRTHLCSHAIVQWYRECAHFHSIHRAIDALRRGDDTCETALPPAATRSVDFLFLIKKSCLDAVDSSAVETLLGTIGALVEQTQDTHKFHDVRAQFGFMVYSPRQKLEYTRDFSSDFPTDLHSHLLSTGTNCSTEDTRLSSNSAIMGSVLSMMSRALRLGSKKNQFHQHFGKKSQFMWHRPYSDLHILCLPDVGRRYEEGAVEGDDDDDLEEVMREKITKFSEKVIAVSAEHPVSLHTFFSESNAAALSILGDPSLSVSYPDCSHFRKAATLKRLIASGHGGSLQAELLAKGVSFQLHHLQALQSHECILKLSPVLSTPLSMKPWFPEKCLEGMNREPERDYYCSSLHGWTERVSSDDDDHNRTLTSQLFEDKVPLNVGEFGSSHADLANSVLSEKDKKSLIKHKEVLSISKSLDTCNSVQFKPTITGQPRTVQWKKKNKSLVKEMIAGKEPTVIRRNDSSVLLETWPTLKKWNNFSYLSDNMDTDVLSSVKCTDNFLTFDPDHRAPLKLNISVTYTTANISTAEFFNCITKSNGPCSDGYLGHYYFGSVPGSLKGDIAGLNDFLYNTKEDLDSSKQFMWISSAEMITHTHFDQDYNMFVQVTGKKRFTLWTATQHELLYVFPRVHPMWHKSRVNFRAVDVRQFPAFTRAEAVQVELGPGDMLYVPPYTWHYVETLSPSVSLSTWSHDYDLYHHMNAIYKHDHKFDLLQSQKGQMFVLRLYLDMMVHDLYGFNETTDFFVRLLNNRFSGLEHLFPSSEDDPEICSSAVPGKIPTCVHVHGYAKLDMGVVGGHFQALEPVVRDILFADYVEEITAQVVGVKKMLAFFRYCFTGQQYYITEIESEEHLLWEHKDSEPTEV